MPARYSRGAGSLAWHSQSSICLKRQHLPWAPTESVKERLKTPMEKKANTGSWPHTGLLSRQQGRKGMGVATAAPGRGGATAAGACQGALIPHLHSDKAHLESCWEEEGIETAPC